MAIRIRNVNGVIVALCAAETDEKPGDIYLDDCMHRALSNKFGLDWKKMGFIDNPPLHEELIPVMESQKARDSEKEISNFLNSNPHHYKWLIWSNEHMSWWSPNQNGYTMNKDEAGRYEFDEALNIIINSTYGAPKNVPNEAIVPDITFPK